jgi:putative FmdB family regulatory protein
MPIYEYRCRDCGFKKEYLQKLSDAPIEVCESCGKATMSKLVSAAGFQLKGSGWYATDFKNPPAKEKPANGEGKQAEDKQTQSKQPDSKQADSKERSTTTADSTAPKSAPAPVQPVSESQS